MFIFDEVEKPFKHARPWEKRGFVIGDQLGGME